MADLPRDKVDEIVGRFLDGMSAKDLVTIYKLPRWQIDELIKENAERINKQREQAQKANVTKMQNKDLSYLECLRWAANAVGGLLHSGEEPKTCPNRVCYAIYTQAQENMKDFLAKLAVAEQKARDEDKELDENRRTAVRSVEEITKMIETLEVQ